MNVELNDRNEIWKMSVDVTKLWLVLNVWQEVLKTGYLSIFKFDFRDLMIIVVTVFFNYSASCDVDKFIVVFLSVSDDLFFRDVLRFMKLNILKGYI